MDRISTSALLAMALFCVAAAGSDESIDVSQQRAHQIRQACTDLVIRYAYSRDRLDYEAYGELFTEDAKFELGGQVAEGREAIVAALRNRGPDSVTRHFSLPVSIEPTSARTATGVAYLQLYMVSANADDGAPQTPPGAPIIADYHDEYEIKGSTCRFQSRKIQIVFNPPSG